jgi:hypothetical protein
MEEVETEVDFSFLNSPRSQIGYFFYLGINNLKKNGILVHITPSSCTSEQETSKSSLKYRKTRILP